MWDYSAMAIKVDSKRRVVVTDPPKRMTRAQVFKVLTNSKLKFDLSGDKLRKVTRAP
jgi:hypothetical protein